jgi:hypothetical protein
MSVAGQHVQFTGYDRCADDPVEIDASVSSNTAQRASEDRYDRIDVVALENQRRRERDYVAGGANEEAAVEAVDHDIVATCQVDAIVFRQSSPIF